MHSPSLLKTKITTAGALKSRENKKYYRLFCNLSTVVVMLILS